jgi:C4-dicarboxylate-specific signal transduction histidine kinase
MNNQKSSSKSAVLLWGLCGVALIFWLAGSWVAANSVQTSRSNALIREQTDTINQQVENIKTNISRNLGSLHGIPSVVAKDGEVIRVLSRTYPATLTAGERKSLWSTNSQFKNISNYLNSVNRSLGADVIYIMNTAGDCIASSNADMPDSFVGANYAARDYFKAAIEGKQGNQYAVGKTSNKAGLYFSAPVNFEGHIIGVVSVKINMSAVAHWVNQTDAFISDQYGVIVLSSDVKLDMRTLVGGAISLMSKEARIARYRRDNFPVLTINVWPGNATLSRFDEEKQPVLLADRTLAADITGNHRVWAG